MTFTYYGQSCFLVKTNQYALLFDPFISGNPLATNIDIASVEADYIFITHGHGDHVADLEKLARQTGATCICAAEIAGWLSQKGFENIHPMNHGGKINFPFGKAKGVNAIHSSTLPDGSNGGNPMGFLVNTEEGDFYIAGDTALTMDMQLIPYWTKGLTFCAFPIGGNYTMDVADAIIAAGFVKCDTIIGSHYNTFPAISIDTEQAKKEFAAAGKQLLLPGVGETITF